MAFLKREDNWMMKIHTQPGAFFFDHHDTIYSHCAAKEQQYTL